MKNLKLKKSILKTLPLAGVVLVSATSFAFAEEEEVNKSADYISRIESRINVLERKVFTSNGEEKGTMMADIEARMQQLEDESSKLYGAVEELSGSVEKLANKFDLVIKDINLRLQDLEAGISSAPKKENTAKASTSSAKAPSKFKAISVPAKISAEKLYKQAYNYMSAADYNNATTWFSEFLKRHPDHKYAENSFYWLGEVYLVENRPQDAIISFSTGLNKFANGPKVPGNLLKMGVAFEKLGQTKHAKSTWEKLINDYPKSGEADKAKEMIAKLK